MSKIIEQKNMNIATVEENFSQLSLTKFLSQVENKLISKDIKKIHEKIKGEIAIDFIRKNTIRKLIWEFNRILDVKNRPNDSKTVDDFVDIWLCWFFGTNNKFNEMKCLYKNEFALILRLYYLAVFDSIFYSLKKSASTKREISALGRLNFENRTSTEYEIFNHQIDTLDTEYEWVRKSDPKNFKDTKILYICGAMCFVLDKEKRKELKTNQDGDSEVGKKEFLQILKNKGTDDLNKLSKLELIENPTKKEEKGIVLCYTSLRTIITLQELLEVLPDDVTIVVGTRHKKLKVSIENFPKSGYDCGSQKVINVEGGDIETLTDIKNVAIKGEIVTVTGGSYDTRITSSQMIREKVESNFELTQDEINRVYKNIQPVRPSVEKTSIITQRQLFLSNKKYILIQCGNRDSVIIQNGEFVAGVSVKLDEKLKDYLMSYWLL